VTAVRALAVLSLVLVLGACGVGTDDAPRTIAAADLDDYDLLGEATTTTTTAPVATVEQTVYLIGSANRLAPVEREVPAPPTIANRLESLLAPVGEDELGLNLGTAIPSGTRLEEVREQNGTILIALSEDLYIVQGDTLKRALAQIVWTATEGDPTRRVQFSVSGRIRDVPDENGVTKREVGPRDYAVLGRRR
jgi:spore germination protein GerM